MTARGRRPAVVVLLVVAVATAGCRGTGRTDGAGAGEGTVVRVVDGDTLDLSVAGERVRVRLIGVDTPETKDENRPVQCYGAEATHYLEGLLPEGTAVRVERDVEARDKYDRLLVYLYRRDDGLFINEALLQGGYATTLSIAPNTLRAGEFEALRVRAQREQRGLWSACPSFGSPVSSR